MKGLIIKPKWAEMILNGEKTMELRGSNTKVRGTIGIIESGTGKIFGSVELVNVVKIITNKTYEDLKCKHRVDMPFGNIPYNQLYGWVLRNPKRFEEPIPYEHKQGQVIWVNDILEDDNEENDYE